MVWEGSLVKMNRGNEIRSQFRSASNLSVFREVLKGGIWVIEKWARRLENDVWGGREECTLCPK